MDPVWTSVISQNSWELQTQVELIPTCNSSMQTSKGCSRERLGRGETEEGFPQSSGKDTKPIWATFFCWRHCGNSSKLCACVLSRFNHVWLWVTLCTIAYRLLCPWDSLSKNTAVCFHALLQGVFPHCRWILFCWTAWEAPNKFCHPSMEGGK